MAGYTKVFASMLASTIWREDTATRCVWITLLLLADRDGVVDASVPGLADIARVTREEAETAIQNFLSPDKDSRDPEYEGRRIERAAVGWRILNHEKYRQRMSAEEMRERDRLRKQRYRERLKACPTASGTTRDNAESSVQSNTQKAEADVKSKSKPTRQVSAGGGLALTLAKDILRQTDTPGTPLLEKTLARALQTKQRQQTKKDPATTLELAAHWMLTRLKTFLRNNHGRKTISLVTFFGEGRYDDDLVVEGCTPEEMRLRMEANVGKPA